MTSSEFSSRISSITQPRTTIMTGDKRYLGSPLIPSSSYHLSGSQGAGSPTGLSVDRTRQLTDPATPLHPLPYNPPPPHRLSLSTHKAGQAALLSYGMKGKTATKTEKAGLLFRTSDHRSSRELCDSWNPMTFNPPVHILK